MTAVYRCRFLDENRRLVGVEAAECADDGTAMRWAAKLCRRLPTAMSFEVWQQERIVGRHRAVSASVIPLTPRYTSVPAPR